MFILKKQESFWILNLRTLYPDGLNQELNSVWQAPSLSSFVQHLAQIPLLLAIGDLNKQPKRNHNSYI